MQAFFTFCICALWSASLWGQNSPSQTEYIDITSIDAHIKLAKHTELVTGVVSYEINIKRDINEFFLDGKNMDVISATVNGDTITPALTNNQLQFKGTFFKDTSVQLELEYQASPKQALYFIDQDGLPGWDQVWSQGQGKYNSHWIPSLDDVNDKAIWKMTVTAPKDLQVAANGMLKTKSVKNEYQTWRYEMEQPMSNYLVALAAGNYQIKRDTTSTGTPIELWYYPEDENKVASTYQHTLAIFNRLEQEIGIVYPWSVYRQIPVKDFLYSGMENTTTTLFSDAFMVDEIGVNDRSYVTVNAHELAHQWFGNLVTATSSKHHWLQEGFATFYALQAERAIYGDDHYYMQLYENAELLIQQNNSGKSTPVIDSKGSSLTYYQYGAWALHALQEEVGRDRFRESVIKYLQQHAFKTVDTDDFLNSIASYTEVDVATFKKTWLEAPLFPAQEALKLLRKSDFMNEYFQLSARRLSDFEQAKQSYLETTEKPINSHLLKEMVAQLTLHSTKQTEDLYLKAAATGDIPSRQMMALSLQELPLALTNTVKNLLYDPSYITRENALFLLWKHLPEQRASLLKEVDKKWESRSTSLDMAWIALALNSSDFKNNEKYAFLKRLEGYTSSVYSPNERLAAFEYLINLEAMSTQNYKDLLDGAQHHSWRFYKECRSMLQGLYKKEPHRSVLKSLIEQTEDPQKKERLLAIVLG